MASRNRETAAFNQGYESGYRDGWAASEPDRVAAKAWKDAFEKAGEAGEASIESAFDDGFKLGLDQGYQRGADAQYQLVVDDCNSRVDDLANLARQGSEDGVRYGIGLSIQAIDAATAGEAVRSFLPPGHTDSVRSVLQHLADTLRQISAGFSVDKNAGHSPVIKTTDSPSVMDAHHCRPSSIEDDHAQTARILLRQDRGLRVALAEIDPDSDAAEFLDHHVPECLACYRDLIFDVADRCTMALTILHETPERATEALRDQLEISSDMIAEHDSGPPTTSDGEATH